MMHTVKEEDEQSTLDVSVTNLVLNQEEEEDELIASYDIVQLNNPKYKAFAVSGLSKVLCRSARNEISIRTDLKELKFKASLDEHTSSVFYTKETLGMLSKNMFAVKLCRETGDAYFIPVNGTHSITLLDAANKDCSKMSDSVNKIFEDGFKRPYPARNKHDQLVIDMKNYLYKPLQVVPNSERFLREFYNSPKAKPNSVESVGGKVEPEKPTVDMMDLVNCHHWQLVKVNLFEIKSIELVELRIEVFLRKAQVARFVELQQILEVDPVKLMSVLQPACHLIRGNWVIKSSLLYKFNAIHDSEARQAHYKDLIAAREFLLWTFAANRTVILRDIATQFQNTPDHEEILRRLTRRNGLDAPVQFVMEEDRQFLYEYSHVAQRHHQKTLALLAKHQNYLATS